MTKLVRLANVLNLTLEKNRERIKCYQLGQNFDLIPNPRLWCIRCCWKYISLALRPDTLLSVQVQIINHPKWRSTPPPGLGWLFNHHLAPHSGPSCNITDELPSARQCWNTHQRMRRHLFITFRPPTSSAPKLQTSTKQNKQKPPQPMDFVSYR